MSEKTKRKVYRFAESLGKDTDGIFIPGFKTVKLSDLSNPDMIRAISYFEAKSGKRIIGELIVAVEQ